MIADENLRFCTSEDVTAAYESDTVEFEAALDLGAMCPPFALVLTFGDLEADDGTSMVVTLTGSEDGETYNTMAVFTVPAEVIDGTVALPLPVACPEYLKIATSSTFTSGTFSAVIANAWDLPARTAFEGYEVAQTID